MKKENNRQPGNVNYIWALAGGYLVYLGGKLLWGLYRDRGEEVSFALGIPFGVLFVVVGGLLLWREWKAYQYAAAHKDDPATWNDELAEAARRETEKQEHETQEDEP